MIYQGMHLCFEARHPRGDQVVSSWWSYGDDIDAKKVRDLEAQGWVVKSRILKRGN